MIARSHVAVGGAAWAGIASLGGAPVEPVGLALAALGALLPDIDHPHSWVGRRVPWLSWPLAAVLGHRGVTHSLVAIALGLVVLLAGGAGWLTAPIVVGYLSHLVADALTPAGVPLLWPSPRVFSARLFQTGSLLEHVFVVAIIAAGAGIAALMAAIRAWGGPA